MGTGAFSWTMLTGMSNQLKWILGALLLSLGEYSPDEGPKRAFIGTILLTRS